MPDNFRPPSTNRVQQPSALPLLRRRQILKWGLPLVGAGAVGVLAPACRYEDLKDLLGLVDYSRLESYLGAGQWKEADQETSRLMLKVVNQEQEGWLNDASIQAFPCDVLSRLDQLWVDNSGGKFGFSVQKKIYVECGGKLDGQYDKNAYLCFADKVGWRKDSNYVNYDELAFSLENSLRGELPVEGLVNYDELAEDYEDYMNSGIFVSFEGEGGVSSLARRLANCNIQ